MAAAAPANFTSRELFSGIVTTIQPIIMTEILTANNNILTLCKVSIDQVSIIEENVPLWIMSGGEAINLYSEKPSETPTKDLDFKLLLCGKWSIPHVFLDKIRQHFNEQQPIKSAGFDTNFITTSIDGIKGYYPCNTKLLGVHNKPYNDLITTLSENLKILLTPQGSSPDLFDMWNIVNESRINIIANVLLKLDGCGVGNNHLRFLNTPSFGSLREFTNILFAKGYGGIFELATQSNSVMSDGTIPIRIMVPYFILGGNINNGPMHTSFPFYPADTDEKNDMYGPNLLLHAVYPNKRGLLNMNRLATSLDEWCALTSQAKIAVTTTHLKTIVFNNLTVPLHSLVSIILYVKQAKRSEENKGDWVIKVEHEGILDLFVDPSAGHNPHGKNVYEGKRYDGNIPCVVHNFHYNDPSGQKKLLAPLKIPTVMWLLRDQLRMLFHGIKDQDTAANGWGEHTFTTTTPANIDTSKYFTKVKRLLVGMHNAIDLLEGNQHKELRDMVAKYKDKTCNDIHSCGPDTFLSHLSYLHNETYWKRLKLTNGGKHIKNKRHINKRKTDKLKQKKRRTRKL